MESRPLRALWVTNMFHQEGDRSFRGIFVTQQWSALVGTGEVELERIVVAQGRGWPDYLLANSRVCGAWSAGRFDLVHVHYGLTALAALRIPREAPLVVTFYGSDLNLALPRALSIAAARRAVRRIFVSRRLARRWPSPRNRVIPNGVDFDRCVPRERAAACAELGLDPSRPRVLFGADPSNPVKGYPLFRAVLDLVRRQVPEAEELVLTAPSQPYERVVAKLNAADCLLFTSRRGAEGSPTVVKEAVAVGLPVVSVDVGDAAEMLEGVRPGAVVAWPASRGEAARRRWMEELAARTVEVLRSGRRSDGRERRAFLRKEEIARRTLEVYREALEEVRAGGGHGGRGAGDRVIE